MESKNRYSVVTAVWWSVTSPLFSVVCSLGFVFHYHRANVSAVCDCGRGFVAVFVVNVESRSEERED